MSQEDSETKGKYSIGKGEAQLQGAISLYFEGKLLPRRYSSSNEVENNIVIRTVSILVLGESY